MVSAPYDALSNNMSDMDIYDAITARHKRLPTIIAEADAANNYNEYDIAKKLCKDTYDAIRDFTAILAERAKVVADQRANFMDNFVNNVVYPKIDEYY
jgi:hypothetical protein